jgi:hypothetical protein
LKRQKRKAICEDKGETPIRKLLLAIKKKKRRASRVVQVVQHLPSKHKTMSSNLKTIKKIKCCI